uniref:G-protein coupled receptors family 1 profile domain-containing protein n=1 Tax=Ornithorhynchus anatinus TaxID=9258 RepID=F7CXZ8_ORNAN
DIQACLAILLCSEPRQYPAMGIVLSIFYIGVLVFGFLGNFLAFCIIGCKRKRNSTDLYLLNLSMSDLLFTLALPGRISYFIQAFSWNFGDWACRLTALLFFMNTYGSIYLMTFVSVDRYIAVVSTRRCHNLRKVGVVRWICAFAWGLAFLLNVPLLLRPITSKMGDRVACMDLNNIEGIFKHPLIVLISCIIVFSVPVGIILFCYVKITLKLIRSARRNSLPKRIGNDKKACVVSMMVLIIVVVCFSPYHLIVIQFMIRMITYQTSCSEQVKFKVSLQITMMIMNANCCIDPIIYFFACKSYKKKLLSILHRTGVTFLSSLGQTSSQSNSSNQTAGLS